MRENTSDMASRSATIFLLQTAFIFLSSFFFCYMCPQKQRNLPPMTSKQLKYNFREQNWTLVLFPPTYKISCAKSVPQKQAKECDVWSFCAFGPPTHAVWFQGCTAESGTWPFFTMLLHSKKQDILHLSKRNISCCCSVGLIYSVKTSHFFGSLPPEQAGRPQHKYGFRQIWDPESSLGAAPLFQKTLFHMSPSLQLLWLQCWL